MASILVITGLSGAGRSEAAAVLEDLGWYVVNNLPTSLVEKIVDLASLPGSTIERLALVAGRNHEDLVSKITGLRDQGRRIDVLFLDADNSVIVRRYESTRRRHPLADEAGGLLEGIETERRLLDPVKGLADLLIDTSEMNVTKLKARLVSVFDTQAMARVSSSRSNRSASTACLDADIVMDVRFLPNPHWVDELRPLTGADARFVTTCSANRRRIRSWTVSRSWWRRSSPP
ncbi:MAG: RNase adapter RapZ [Ilumatobacteraceae bacterium]